MMYNQGIQRYYEVLIIDLVKLSKKKDIKVTIFIVGNFSKMKEKIKRTEISEYVGDIVQFTDILSKSTDIVLTDYRYLALVKEEPTYVISSIPSVEKEFILLKETANRIMYEKMGVNNFNYLLD